MNRVTLMMQWAIRFVLVALIVCGTSELVSACPTCKEALLHNNERGIALGYYWSILFMMSMPFCIFAGWMFYIWRVCRGRRSTTIQTQLPAAS